ncbi:hypothetical protein DVH05_001945 [Phytophthora capsici]|nr:hypothetical protein DVH05_001945 [Phytophthora capsici]
MAEIEDHEEAFYSSSLTSTTHAYMLESSTKLHSKTSKDVAFTELAVDSMVESTSPIQPKIPRSGDLGNNSPAQTSATSHSLPQKTGVTEQDQPDNLVTLKLPDIPDGISSRGYAMIKEYGEEQLRQLVKNEGDVPYPTVTNLWSCWETPSEIIEDKAVKEAGEEKKLVPAAGLLRLERAAQVWQTLSL